MRPRAGDLVLFQFPHKESGKNRKLSRPWHGPYRVIRCNESDVTVVKQFFPEEGNIQVHQLRVCPCPNYQSATTGMEGSDIVMGKHLLG